MTIVVGNVVRAFTTKAAGKGPTPKFHLCVCDQEWHFLFVSKNQYPNDYPLSNVECEGLERATSWLSLSPVLHVPKMRRYETVCTVSHEYLRGLYKFAQASKVMSPVDKRKVLTGIARKLGD